jgi:hypothetical protein
MHPRWRELIEGECPRCGEGVFALAKSCPHCGAPNTKARLAGFSVAGALGVLVVAVVAALVLALTGQGVTTGDTGAPGGERIEAKGSGDFAWLTDAMSACEAQAQQETGTLYFLLLPLASLARDDAQWRAKSIIDVGNAILLRTDDALDGLRSGALRVYTGKYNFKILDVTANTVYQWKPSTGVTKVSASDSSAITQFKLQFQTASSAADAQWGDPFNRQTGACYWVNAIIAK